MLDLLVNGNLDCHKYGLNVLNVPKFTANLYCIYLSIHQIYTCGKLGDTQHNSLHFLIHVLFSTFMHHRMHHTNYVVKHSYQCVGSGSVPVSVCATRSKTGM